MILVSVTSFRFIPFTKGTELIHFINFCFTIQWFRMFVNHSVLAKSTICVSVCLMAGWCLLLSVYHCIGVFAFSWTGFQLPVLIFHTSSTSHTCSSFLASFLSLASSCPLQVVQDLLPLIFQLRRWFLRCPNCSSLCFQRGTTRRSWDLRLTTSRSAEAV